MASYPIVRLRYVDSAIQDHQTSSMDPLRTQVSDAAGFLIRDTDDCVEIAREVFEDSSIVELRGRLSVPRCALLGKLQALG